MTQRTHSKLARRFEGRLRIRHFRTDKADPDLRPPRPLRPFDTIGTAQAISYEHYQPGQLDGRRRRTAHTQGTHIDPTPGGTIVGS